MKKIAILQSNYLPWKGYFDIIAAVDEFIIYDCVQYTKNDWRNRNQIKTTQGKAWLTVPVRHAGMEQAIDEVEIADSGCFRRHWRTFCQSYAKAAHISYCRDGLETLFEGLGDERLLGNANVRLLRAICRMLGLGTVIRDAREYDLSGDRNERLVSICRQAGASVYLSGAAAKSYLDEEQFRKAGVEVSWMSYEGYTQYPQPHPPFDHHVSVLDLLACVGTEAQTFLLNGGRREA